MNKEVGKDLFYDEEDGTHTERAGRGHLQVPSDKKSKDKDDASELVVKLGDETFDNENDPAENAAGADEDALHDDNVEMIYEVGTERNRPPSPRDGRHPGAFRVQGPDYNGGDEEVTVGTLPSVNSPSSTDAADVAVLAHLVDGDEENRILNQRIEEALQEERDRAAVAEVVPQPVDSSGKKRKLVGGIVFLIIATAIVAASVVSTQVKQSPTSVAPPTLSPTSSTQAPPVTGPVERLQQDGFEMELVGTKPLESQTQSLWKEETELFIVTRIVDEVFPDEVRVLLDLVSQDPPPFESRQLQASQSDELQIKFDAEIFIASGVEEYTAFEYIFGAFDSSEEQSAYIEALKARGNEAFANLTSVQVVMASSSGNPLEWHIDENLTISLFSVTTLSTDSWFTFSEIYTEWYNSFYESFPQFDIDILLVDLELVSQKQSQEELVLVFNQTTKIAKGTGLGSAEVITQPFLSENSQNLFAAELRESGDPAFADIRGVSALTGKVEL